MKSDFPIKEEGRMQNAEASAALPAPLHASRFTLHPSRPTQSGVALVITLILLAVITFMAITFLVVMRSERSSVAMQTEMTVAQLGADTARDRAIAELLAPILATNNPFNSGLLVSTNFINTNGFAPGVSGALNVNYDYKTDNTAFTSDDIKQNIANLWYNPRPPVFVAVTNAATNFIDFRYYIDLNRNRRFDSTGWIAQTNELGKPMGFVSYELGDPQWIGLLQHPEYFHSADNLFSSRYAYFVVPIGQTLDLNTIHNFAKYPAKANMLLASDGFLRNQGILTSEINFAALLADLNTNLWPLQATPTPLGFANTYNYAIDPAFPALINSPNTGQAFDNAIGCLTYRYNQNYKSLAGVSALFGTAGSIAFTNPMDLYSGGPLMNGTWWPPSPLLNPNANKIARRDPWSASYNPNAFTSPQDLFDEGKTAANLRATDLPKTYTLTKLLKMAGTNVSSYDRTTFYRLASQLGTYSTPGTEDKTELSKMNLNYCNVDTNGYVVPGAVTNFAAWSARQFFTNAAIRLLVDAGYTVRPPINNSPYSTSNLLVARYVNGLLVTNLCIPVWPTNYYTPSLHRILQLAANIYDATTNRADLTDYPYLPTVFRPTFSEIGLNQAGQRQVFVVNYSELAPFDLGQKNNPFTGTMLPHDLSDADDSTRLGLVQSWHMVYNVPLVIGAKKGLPSFDELAMQTIIQAARKLIYHRQNDDPAKPVNEIDPQYLITVTNQVGIQARNPYSMNYPRTLQLQVWPDTSVLISNVENQTWLNKPMSRYPLTYTNYPLIGLWQGYNTVTPTYSFITPMGSPEASYMFMPTNSSYSFASQTFVVNGSPDRTPGFTNFAVPQFQVTVKARLRYALVDTTANRLVDYVDVAANTVTNLAQVLMVNPDGTSACGGGYSPTYSKAGMWCTNLSTGKAVDPRMTLGVRMQIDACKGSLASVNWNDSLPDPVYGGDHAKAVTFFQAQFDLGSGAGVIPHKATFGAPYQPYRNVKVITLWQANDPLVHYTVGDLKNTSDFPGTWYLDTLPKSWPPTDYRTPNDRCAPWGGRLAGDSASVTKYDWRIKDSVPTPYGTSDDWDFPANKLPHAGWLGRVHRGSPWQSIYLKSAGIDYPTWIRWSGNDQVVTNYGQLSSDMPQFFTVVSSNVVGGATRITTNQVAYDCTFATPTNDWRLLDIFTTAITPNATRGRLSINQPGIAAWSAVLSGVIALTNTVDTAGKGVSVPTVVQPAGYYDPTAPTNTWPAVARIVNGINAARKNANPAQGPVFQNQVFHRLGDLLSVPELTTASPFLAINSPSSTPAIPMPTDAAFERLPQQILGLLQCDQTPRFAIYAYGQALKPAPRSRVTSGSFFGLCTNYQITAEVATRTIVRFDGVPTYGHSVATLTNLHPVIESFTVLPPD
jgi:hypothetical protein